MKKRIIILVMLMILGAFCNVQQIGATDFPCSNTTSVPCHAYKYINLGPCGNGFTAAIIEGAGDKNVDICTGSGNGDCQGNGTVSCRYTVTTDDCNGVATGAQTTETVRKDACN